MPQLPPKAKQSAFEVQAGSRIVQAERVAVDPGGSSSGAGQGSSAASLTGRSRGDVVEDMMAKPTTGNVRADVGWAIVGDAAEGRADRFDRTGVAAVSLGPPSQV